MIEKGFPEELVEEIVKGNGQSNGTAKNGTESDNKLMMNGNLDIDKKNDMKDTIQKLFVLKQNIQNKSLEKIQFAQPILSINNFPVLYPNSITLMQGQKGSYKSKLSELMISLLLQMENYFVLYIDTERSTRDGLPQAIQNILLKAIGNLDCFPEDAFSTFSFIDIHRAERLNILKYVIEYERQLHQNKNIIVCLDVLSDFVSDFNDPKQSLELLDFLNRLINQSDIAIISVLHENPNTTKSRGHLGTEVTNKSTLVLKCSSDGDFAILEYLHSRYRRLEKEKLNFKYSIENHGLIYYEKSQEIEVNKSELYLSFIYELLQDDKKLSQTELVHKLLEKFVNYGKLATQRNTLLSLKNKIFNDKKLIRDQVKENSIWWYWIDKDSSACKDEKLNLEC